jgi:hypothetical protein
VACWVDEGRPAARSNATIFDFIRFAKASAWSTVSVSFIASPPPLFTKAIRALTFPWYSSCLTTSSTSRSKPSGSGRPAAKTEMSSPFQPQCRSDSSVLSVVASVKNPYQVSRVPCGSTSSNWTPICSLPLLVRPSAALTGLPRYFASGIRFDMATPSPGRARPAWCSSRC